MAGQLLLWVRVYGADEVWKQRRPEVIEAARCIVQGLVRQAGPAPFTACQEREQYERILMRQGGALHAQLEQRLSLTTN
jgi:hypothetical protein